MVKRLKYMKNVMALMAGKGAGRVVSKSVKKPIAQNPQN